VRSLRLCQKHIRSQYGKDPMILARTILETNEIVLVLYSFESIDDSILSLQHMSSALNIKTHIVFKHLGRMLSCLLHLHPGLHRLISFLHLFHNTMQHSRFSEIFTPVPSARSIQPPERLDNRPTLWKKMT